MNNSIKKIGILGGGQLGRMFIENALRYPLHIHILDPQKNAPCSTIAHKFVQGDFNDYKTVLNFGKEVDVIGIEIEHVNIKAIEELESLGKIIIPSSSVLKMIQNKGLQKQFYIDNNIPTSEFYLINNSHEINLTTINYPFVQKLRKGGYDGKGVQIIKNKSEIKNIWNQPSVIEKAVEIDKELAVIFVKKDKEIKQYDVVEMVFDNNLNLVDYLFCPSLISNLIKEKVKEIINQISQSIQGNGIYAVELFLTNKNEILVNEIAPRVHNSGHHTIESTSSSQFDNYFRLLADFPLGATKSNSSSLMINLIGEKGFEGKVKYVGLEKILTIPNILIHIYGKEETKEGRKMGHITILGNNLDELIKIKNIIKNTIKIQSY